MATHSTILIWEAQWMEEPHLAKEADKTYHLNNNDNLYHSWKHPYFLSFSQRKKVRERPRDFIYVNFPLHYWDKTKKLNNWMRDSGKEKMMENSKFKKYYALWTSKLIFTSLQYLVGSFFRIAHWNSLQANIYISNNKYVHVLFPF